MLQAILMPSSCCLKGKVLHKSRAGGEQGSIKDTLAKQEHLHGSSVMLFLTLESLEASGHPVKMEAELPVNARSLLNTNLLPETAWPRVAKGLAVVVLPYCAAANCMWKESLMM